MTSPIPAAVLWDMDGTLVDTEAYWMASETALVERFGGVWTHEQALQLVGSGLEASAEILQRAGVRMSTTEIIDHLTEQVMEMIARDGNPFRPGALELLSALKDAGIPTGLVTMSLGRMAHLVAQQIPFAAFDVIVSGDDVERPKPFPDAYLKACVALGVDPADTVAIEDSPTGARAAVAAGTVAIGVPLFIPLDDTGVAQIWPTLAGRTPADLAEVHTAHRTEGAA